MNTTAYRPGVVGGNGDVNAAVPTTVITLENVVKRYPLNAGLLRRARQFVEAVAGVSFEIRKGETLGLVGESGSGKSTIARLIMRLADVTSGTISFLGDDITSIGGSELRNHRRRVQMVFQDPYSSLDPLAPIVDSVGEPLATHFGMSSADRSARVAELLDLVGLAKGYLNRYPSELSGGQLQRAAIARALAVEPTLLVLDEPVSALDVSTQAQVINLLQDLQDELGISYLFVAHDLSVVRHISHRIAVMYLGAIVEQADAEDVYLRPTHPYTQALLSAVPIPDPVEQRQRKRVILSGDIPSPADPPSGCRFRTRCPVAMEICTTSPEPFAVPSGGTTLCHLHTSGPELRGRSVHTLVTRSGGTGPVHG